MPTLDNGGIYIDHFSPGWSTITNRENIFQSYLEVVVGGHKDYDRILLWDICNEPFSYIKSLEEMKEIKLMEYKWLEKIYFEIKDIGAKSPVGISIHPGHKKYGLMRIEPISDILLVHPYLFKNNQKEKQNFTSLFDIYVDLQRSTGKPMIVTETCWGSLDDYWRVKNIKYTLAELKKRNLGWLVHALNHSLVADLHREEHGPVGWPGYLAFIEADGSLRRGHEIFNDF